MQICTHFDGIQAIVWHNYYWLLLLLLLL